MEIPVQYKYLKTYQNKANLERALKHKQLFDAPYRHLVLTCPETGRLTPIFVLPPNDPFMMHVIIDAGYMVVG